MKEVKEAKEKMVVCKAGASVEVKAKVKEVEKMVEMVDVKMLS